MRLVLLTRYYPPEVSGGARRPNALVQSLRGMGIDVLVIAPQGALDPNLVGVPHPSYPAVPGSASSNSNSDVQQKQHLSFSELLRLTLLLPDPEIRWALRAARVAREAVSQADWFMTTSPPESLHVAGRLLKSWTKTPWIADVRDLWLGSPQLKARTNAPIRQGIERMIARHCLSHADALVGVSPVVLAEAQRLSGKEIPSAIIGHFAMPFTSTAAKLPDETFNIVHTGAISISNPLSAFSELLADFEAVFSARSNARLWLVGYLTPQERALILKSPAHSAIIQQGPVSMEEARAWQAGSDALALVSGRSSHALPGKVSEYLTVDRPILISAPGPWLDLLPENARAYPFHKGANLPKPSTKAEAKNSLASSSQAAAQSLVTLLDSVKPRS